MPKHEYYKISIILIPQEISDEYNLMDNKFNSFIYVKVKKGMYGLVQAGLIAHTALRENLIPFRYWPLRITPALYSSLIS